MSEQTFVTVGRRKTARARVRLTRGTGKVIVNGKEPADYFKTEDFTRAALSPLTTVEMADQVDIIVKAEGGGLNGQAGATRLGIARALEKLNSELRVPLKQEGHMKRDPRSRERKKSGQPGARKRFQFSKR
ncbi:MULTISPECIES: 30S ribosomal protein S9 [unclassified Lentimonas]|uniref:30S ribosomal protein S9 n=1 Tax=unclassified Lentimonas TaxID=2630993 RepID=UPI0013254DCA|nr:MULTISPECIES: 30S ribosomal protein S9 [unclassified Lentimonas]CAA6678727.1 SSU ribosomal protein S9p (S16e) [Lentimonas sp. CC4]CAA6683713.1 SSU ribosomal protein S9p (S16e) [Lentimonas sp. CC6]CAA6691346.1 SSU ribosomal protein S9p (S16e) [Lentimonas sp. CC19]CAA6694901.1 SSU ribosomal protein S9p (S16e) [Lentimonas sp. CC10]CAA7071907.1 SSU ribosomal protein S9p (S16e) [Lentimonas sp. CC11]